MASLSVGEADRLGNRKATGDDHSGKMYAASETSQESNPQSSSKAVEMPRPDSPLAGAEDGNDLDPGAFDHVVGSLEDRSVNGLTERISGMDFRRGCLGCAVFMGEYNMGVGQDGLSLPAFRGMGSTISLEGEDLNNRSSLSAFEGVDASPTHQQETLWRPCRAR